jgi:hypothetical protein
MADGHACALMGFTWGLAGTYASNDTKLKKKVTDHYKAWFNLARCHGSDSYVILPGRDYADSSYYRDNIRNHTTAAMAFIYSYSTPKLRVHGRDGKVDASPKPAAAKLRSFYNADRSKYLEARLVAFDPGLGMVRVSLKNGDIRDLEFLSLSKEDQEYIKQNAAKDPADSVP